MRRRPHRNLRPREEAPLPAERLGGIGFVFMPPDRIIAPWPTHNAMTPDDQRRLLCVLDFVNAARPDGPCWIWPERGEPVLLDAPDIGRWFDRWSEGRAVYVAGRATG